MTRRSDPPDLFGIFLSDATMLTAMGLLGYGAFLWYKQSTAAPAAAGADDPSTDQSATAPPPATDPQTTPPNNIMIFPPPAAAGTIKPGQFAVSAAGEAFTKNIEKLRLTRYKDGNGYSIGWGHHIQSGENIPNTITAAFADQLFDRDVAKVNAAMNARILVPLSQGQIDALGDWIYNVGVTAFGNSTLLKDLNAGNYSAASAELGRWTHSNGQMLTQLADRRAAEQQLFGSA